MEDPGAAAARLMRRKVLPAGTKAKLATKKRRRNHGKRTEGTPACDVPLR